VQFFDSVLQHFKAPINGYVDDRMNNKTAGASQLMTLRQAVRELLPFCETFVTYDIVVLIMAADETNASLNIKAINALLPYSPSYMRQIFRDLERDGLIEVGRDPRDKRNSILKPTGKLRTAFSAFGRRAASILGPGGERYDIKTALAALA
jgi:DNA-binding MarR family transcriptional regulator